MPELDLATARQIITAVRDWAEETPLWFEGASRVSAARMGLPLIGSKGGVTVTDGDGRVLGAVGIAGKTGEQDEALAIHAIEITGLVAAAR